MNRGFATETPIQLLRVGLSSFGKYLGPRKRALQITRHVDRELLGRGDEIKGVVLDFEGVQLMGLAFFEELLARMLAFVRRPEPDAMFLAVTGANEEIRELVELALERQKALALSASSVRELQRGRIELLGGPDYLHSLFDSIRRDPDEATTAGLKDAFGASRTNTANRLAMLREFGVVRSEPVAGHGQPLTHKPALTKDGSVSLITVRSG